MANFSRQSVSSDAASLIYILFGLVLYLLVFYWFYSILKRIEKTLQEVKKLLESKAQNPTQ